MSRESVVMSALAIASVLFLTVLGRPSKPRESLFLFLLAQTVTWPITIFAVYWNLMESPVRLFPKATDSNFVLAFIFLPAVFVLYYCYYPRSMSRVLQIAYHLAFTGCVSLLHVSVQKYTSLLVYMTLSGYQLWPIAIVLYYLQRIYSDWFFCRLEEQMSGNVQ